jgi:hypothetical protein
MGKLRRRLVAVGAITALTVLFVGAAFAVTTAEWEPRTTKWQESICKESLLKSTESAANNQKIAQCFSLSRLQEDKASIATLQAQVSKLEANQQPAPQDFTFFSQKKVVEGERPVSPTLDAGKYKTLVVAVNASVSSVSLEVSNDQESWITQVPELFRNGGSTIPISGRYYRLTAVQPKGNGSGTVSAVGHLTS